MRFKVYQTNCFFENFQCSAGFEWSTTGQNIPTLWG